MAAKETPAKKAAAEKPKAKRRMLTDAERVAKLEADLAAAKKKAEDKARAKHRDLSIKKSGLVERRNALDKDIKKIEAEMAELVKLLPGDAGNQ